MAKLEEILEQKLMIDKVARFIVEESSSGGFSQSELAWVLLDALATYQLKFVKHDENIAAKIFVEGIIPDPEPFSVENWEAN